MPSIEVICVECGAVNRVNENMAGRRVRCPGCDTAVHVPEIDPDILLDDKNDDDEFTLDLDDDSDDTLMAQAVGTRNLDQDQFGARGPLAKPPAAAQKEMPSPLQQPVGSLDEGSRIDDDDDDRVLPRKKRQEPDMDMTPMVDVTFLLLIFFMVTAAFSLQKSIEVPRQQTDAPSTTVVEEEQEDLDMVELQVDEFGSFLVMAPDWERETPGKQNLIRALKEAMEANSGAMRLVVKVHEFAKLEALVDAMDAGTIAGYSELQVTQVEEFD